MCLCLLADKISHSLVLVLLALAATLVHLVQRSLFVLVVRYDTNGMIQIVFFRH